MSSFAEADSINTNVHNSLYSVMGELANTHNDLMSDVTVEST